MNANIPWRPSYDALAHFAAEQSRRLEALTPKLSTDPLRPYNVMDRIAAEQLDKLCTDLRNQLAVMEMERNEARSDGDDLRHERDDLRRQLDAAHEKLSAYSNLWGEMYARNHS